jgi:hypothetical protein
MQPSSKQLWSSGLYVDAGSQKWQRRRSHSLSGWNEHHARGSAGGLDDHRSAPRPHKVASQARQRRRSAYQVARCWSNEGSIAAEASLGAASLPAVRMPNRDGFESGWSPARP